ncbi:hypothetical protein [Halorussus sp. MSC15.2]|uniref:DUF7322 domain-containing protein n=1 Tax=Halorussus sp. MSC15.2 TaxID=2283638 RepID=UPI0013D2D942|nr:hypothetical protein [Halorussus sp. MSC15.2]NEU57339.1 hypothetical protein [Halorussus sp. MSC15.2]
MAPDDSTPDDTDPPDTDLLPEDPPEAETDLLPDDPSEGLAPDPPQVSVPSEEDAPTEVKKEFWSLVLLFNVALFGMSLGIMLVGFEGRWEFGGAIFAVGAFAFARGWYGYRKATDTSGDADGETDADDDEGGATDADDSEREVPDETSDDAELQKD